MRNTINYSFFFTIIVILGNMPSSFGENNKNESHLLDWTSSINWIFAIVGIGGLLLGVYEYRETQKIKRKDVFFYLIREFDNSKEMHLAKRILDGFIYNYSESEHLGINYFAKSNLDKILRYHNKTITDKNEIKFRDSFSSLFDFFDKLEYLYSDKLLKPKELRYFYYYIDKARKSPGVLDFVKNYEYRWNEKLPIMLD